MRSASRPKIPDFSTQLAASSRALIMSPVAAAATSARDGLSPIGSGVFGFVRLNSHAPSDRRPSQSKGVVAFIECAVMSEPQVDREEEAARRRERRYVDVPDDRLVSEVRHFGVEPLVRRGPQQIAPAER